MNKKKFFSYFCLLCFLLVCACSHTKQQPTAEQLYNEANKYLKIGVYDIAAKKFEAIEDEHPFSKPAKDGLIMSAYSYYKDKQYEESLRIIDYFIQSNPIDSNLDYMYYLRALNYYDRVSSVKKARDILENADRSLMELIRKYPETKYAQDATKKKITTETFLSGNEMEIGMFYMTNKNNIGALRHFNYIIENYPRSNFVPEAYYRTMEIHLMMGATKEAENTLKIMKKEYNSNQWFKFGNKLMKKYASETY